MTPKQRVHAALRKEPVNRIPIFMWFHPGTRLRLADLLEIAPQHVDTLMGNDVRMTWVNNNYAMEGFVHERDGQSHVENIFAMYDKAGVTREAIHDGAAGLRAGSVAGDARCGRFE